MFSSKQKARRINNKRLLLLTFVAIVLGGVYFYWQQAGDKKSSPVEDYSNLPSEKDDKVVPGPSPTRDGGASDTPYDPATNQGDGIKSESGDITVFQPEANALFEEGDVVSGLSNSDTVSYRLIDDQIGVIGTGELKVVGGKFSGKFSFNSAGMKGRLDIFHTADDLTEKDVVEIPIRYR